MITYNQLKEKCTCWTGYKRRPGTKPCEEDSCMKEEKDALGHGSEKHHVMAFGRMNPPTVGHEQVVNKIHDVAKEHNATHGLVLSGSHDTTDKEKKAAKNPLSPEQKAKHAKNAFPGTNITSAKKGETILHHAAAAHKAGVQHLHVVAGSDRHEELHNLLHKYNNKESAHGHYNFKSITLHSSGARDPDSEGTTGISGSKMREHAKTGNKEAFHAGAPSKMSPKHKDAMYNDLRKNMNIKEETTPYWKKSSFNKRMSALAKQERLAREKKEKEQKPVKEETAEQQDDHEKQLKRFHDQMTHANGPQKETETELDKLEKQIMTGALEAKHGLMHNPDPSIESHVRVGKIKQMSEKLEPNMGAGTYINDFIKSTNPRFNNKSKEERRKMAIGAYMAAKAKLKEGAYEDAEENKRSAESAKKQGDMFAHHLHMADHHDNLSQWHSEKGRNNVADIHARKAEEHHEKAMSLKEGTEQPNGTDKIETSTSAPTASTVKDTTMGKKIKGFKFFKGETDMNQPVKEQAPVAPVPDKKYIKGTPENKAYKATKKPINGHPTNVKEAKDQHEYADGEMSIHELKQIKAHVEWILEMLEPDTDLPEWVQAKITLAADYLSTACDYLHVEMNEETLDERNKQNALMRKTMDASRGARWKVQNKVTGDQVRDWDNKHPNAQAQNKAIGRALRNEAATTGNPGFGYHGQHKTTHDADQAYAKIHSHVKSLTDSDDKTVKHYLDSAHGRHLVGHENDHEHIKKDFKKFKKHYRPEMHEAAPVDVEKVNAAGDKPHEEKWETAPKKVSKLKKEETMKSYKEFLQSLDEKLIGGQKKLDKNKNGQLDKQDFEMLRNEEVEELDEMEFDKSGRYVHKGTYGSSYNPKPGHEETPDDEKAAEKAGRKAGQKTGSYKPRKTMSKLKSAGATYK